MPTTKTGKFFLPSDTSLKIAGELKYSLDTGVYLKLFGVFPQSNFNKFQNVEIIHGEIEGNQVVTLFKNLELARKGIFSSIESSTYHCALLIIGGWFDGDHDLKFISLKATIPALDLWYNTSRAIKHIDKSIHYEYPESCSIQLEKRTELKLNPRYIISANRKYSGITSTLDLIFTTTRKIHIKDLLTQLDAFQKFLILTTQRPIFPTEVGGRFKIGRKKKEYPVNFCYELTYYNKNEKYNRFIFTYEQIQEHVPTLIANWYNLTNEIRPVLNSFFSVFTGKSYYDDKFLNVARAIEGFYKHKRKRKATFIECMIGVYEESRRGFNHLLKIRSKNKFCMEVYNFRNELTHHNLDHDVLNRISRENRLFEITESLILIFTCQLMLEIGFSINEVRKLVENPAMFQAVRKDKYGINI